MQVGLLQDRNRHKPVAQKNVEKILDLLQFNNRRCGMEFCLTVSYQVEGHMKVYSHESTKVKVCSIRNI